MNSEKVEVLRNCAFMLKDGTKYMKEEQSKQFQEAYEGAIKALDREETVLKALEDVRAEITENLESIIGKYDSNTKPEDMPSRKIERNNGRTEAIDIINRKIKEISGKDCRDCKKWNDCECGKKGHDKDTSIGYSVGECAEYEVTKNEDCMA